MSTVVSRTFRSSPYRDAAETWSAIVDLLCAGRTIGARAELLAIAGVASSIIADRAPKDVPIVVTCEGPRTRLYCLYGEDAVVGSDENEGPLGFDALKGDWRVSLPCDKDELSWVQPTLKKHSSRITARDLESVVGAEQANGSAQPQLMIDPKAFVGQ
jgi:hypothetical protein